MNYLIYLGIFVLGSMFGMLLMVIFFVAKGWSSIDGHLSEDCEQYKIDKRCFSNNKKTSSEFPLKEIQGFPDA